MHLLYFLEIMKVDVIFIAIISIGQQIVEVVVSFHREQFSVMFGTYRKSRLLCAWSSPGDRVMSVELEVIVSQWSSWSWMSSSLSM
mgnify:CR=1 FL=1